MKNDPYFKFVAAIVIAGVFIALLSPARHTVASQPTAQIEATAHAAEAAQ